TLVKMKTFTLNVGGPNFMETITPSTGSLLGTPATYTVTFLTAGGMNTPIDVSCASPAAGIVCSAYPDQVTPGVTPGNQSVIHGEQRQHNRRYCRCYAGWHLHSPREWIELRTDALHDLQRRCPGLQSRRFSFSADHRRHDDGFHHLLAHVDRSQWIRKHRL